MFFHGFLMKENNTVLFTRELNHLAINNYRQLLCKIVNMHLIFVVEGTQ